MNGRAELAEPAPAVLRGVAGEGAQVRLDWASGERNLLHARWLRNACRCDACGDTRPGLRWITPADVPSDIRAAELALAEGGGRLEVTWADGHRSVYEASWLAEAAYDDAGNRARRRLTPRTWGAGMERCLQTVEYGAAMTEDAALFEALRALRDDGIVRLTDGPVEATGTAEIAERFGPVRTTSYGRVQDLVSKPNPKVAGETARAQVPHTDEPFRYSPPGFIFFHCVKSGAEGGGTSIMVDGFHVAERLRREAPEAFALLSRRAVVHHREHPGEVSFHAEGHAICLDREGAVTGIRFNDRSLAPPECPPEEMDALLDALAQFVEQLRDPDNQLRILLRPGDVLVFDNQRILHGRTAFDPNLAERHLRSCHVDRDAVHSRCRTLASRFAPGEADLVLPQGAIL